MKKSIYSYYKERLIEIGGSNKCLYLKSVTPKTAYDIGKILQGRSDKVMQFIDFLWSGGKTHFTLFSGREKKSILENLDVQSRIENRKVETATLLGDELIKKSLQNEKIRKEESIKIKRIIEQH